MRQVGQALQDGFKNLQVVQFGSRQAPEALDRVCLELGCRVQGIYQPLMVRDVFAELGPMWEGIKAAVVRYDAVPGRLGEGVRRLVGVEGEGGKDRKE